MEQHKPAKETENKWPQWYEEMEFYVMDPVLDWIMTLNDAYVLIPGTYKCYLIWKQDFTHVIKLKIWDAVISLDYPLHAKCNYKYPYKDRQDQIWL